MGKVQRTVSVLITGTNEITPHAALDVLLDLPPFDIFYKRRYGVIRRGYSSILGQNNIT